MNGDGLSLDAVARTEPSFVRATRIQVQPPSPYKAVFKLNLVNTL